METPETPDISDEELLGVLSEEELAPVKPKKSKIIRRVSKTGEPTPFTKASDKECETFVNEVLANYKGLVSESKHWSLTLVAIINRINYVPHRSLCARPATLPYDPRDITALAIVQKHVSVPMLTDLMSSIKEWVKENPDATITMDGVEGAIVITEGETLAYQLETPKVETKAGSSTKEGWGSW